MKTIQLLELTDLYQYAPFLVEAVEGVLTVSRETVTAKEVFNFLQRGIKTDDLGVFVQLDAKDKPIAVSILALRYSDTNIPFVEIILVYNSPEAETRMALEDHLIPWAKTRGAKLLRTYDPTVNVEREMVTSRRLRKYGFTKAATLYERTI